MNIYGESYLVAIIKNSDNRKFYEMSLMVLIDTKALVKEVFPLYQKDEKAAIVINSKFNFDSDSSTYLYSEIKGEKYDEDFIDYIGSTLFRIGTAQDKPKIFSAKIFDDSQNLGDNINAVYGEFIKSIVPKFAKHPELACLDSYLKENSTLAKIEKNLNDLHSHYDTAVNMQKSDDEILKSLNTNVGGNFSLTNSVPMQLLTPKKLNPIALKKHLQKDLSTKQEKTKQVKI